MTVTDRQRGFTLIELMVSLLIGLLLIAGILSVFVNSKRSYNTRDSLSLMEENGRVALIRLQRGISPAGYPLYDDVVPVVFDATNIADVTVSSNGDDAAGDRITIAFRPTGVNTTDCLGSDVTRDGFIVNSYYVGTNQTLMCDGGSAAPPQPLAEGIESLQALYGLDADEDGFADHYRNAEQVNAEIAGDPETQLNVVSVQLSLLVNSQKLARDEKPSQTGFAARTFSLLDAEVEEPDDLLERKVFSTIIPLRNRMPLCDDCE